jgi:hypothetical protein
VNVYLMYKIGLKTLNLGKFNLISIKSVNSDLILKVLNL